MGPICHLFISVFLLCPSHPVRGLRALWPLYLLRDPGLPLARVRPFPSFPEDPGAPKMLTRSLVSSSRGRKLTPQGQRDLDRIAGQVAAANKKH
uniref:Uncharacterized protein n=1 Tax=Anolis carolinensis TaxID=28377 RepID=A0A803STZ5_ANOCA